MQKILVFSYSNKAQESDKDVSGYLVRELNFQLERLEDSMNFVRVVPTGNTVELLLANATKIKLEEKDYSKGDLSILLFNKKLIIKCTSSMLTSIKVEIVFDNNMTVIECSLNIYIPTYMIGNTDYINIVNGMYNVHDFYEVDYANHTITEKIKELPSTTKIKEIASNIKASFLSKHKIIKKFVSLGYRQTKIPGFYLAFKATDSTKEYKTVFYLKNREPKENCVLLLREYETLYFTESSRVSYLQAVELVKKK